MVHRVGFFQYRVGLGGVLKKKSRVSGGLGRVEVFQSSIRYFWVPYLLSRVFPGMTGISGYFRYTGDLAFPEMSGYPIPNDFQN